MPHALRSLALVIPLTILSAYGLLNLKKPLLIIASLIIFFEASRYLYLYHQTYPRIYASHWQYGYSEMINYVNSVKDNYQKIFITRELGRPSIYYWFYSKTDPSLVQIQNDLVKKDQGEFLEFENISFTYSPEILDILCKLSNEVIFIIEEKAKLYFGLFIKYCYFSVL